MSTKPDAPEWAREAAKRIQRQFPEIGTLYVPDIATIIASTAPAAAPSQLPRERAEKPDRQKLLRLVKSIAFHPNDHDAEVSFFGPGDDFALIKFQDTEYEIRERGVDAICRRVG